MAASFLIVITSALFAATNGLSMALGAFVAGLLLAAAAPIVTPHSPVQQFSGFENAPPMLPHLWGQDGARTPFVTQKLGEAPGPIVATSDYVSDLPDLIRPYLPQKFASLGADDHGFSDTRAAARRYFHIDAHSVVVRALQLLAEEGTVGSDIPAKAAEKYRLLDVKAGVSGNAGGDA